MQVIYVDSCACCGDTMVVEQQENGVAPQTRHERCAEIPKQPEGPGPGPVSSR